MKFLMSQNRHRCIPVGRIENISIVSHGVHDEYWKIEVTSNKPGKGLEKHIMGVFDTLEDAEIAITKIMVDFDDGDFFAKVMDNPRRDRDEQ
jgi:hypothetical protein